MLKDILNLSGSKKLSKDEQKKVNGGAGPICDPFTPCPIAPPCPPGTIEVCCQCVPCY
ncbi:hypothetical protein GWK08_13510 [Leptobacterium flavescens]|uniref:Bacteriocin n=1 Tax=Leptobacterium flavescens TaxID=472055 RepID=A0A6P0UMQ0_9FLAO|nr:hypothetical protein [Leptobacterium flavescens]NER14465.1 hypothetical protein [Leptobacterium flavescens]